MATRGETSASPSANTYFWCHQCNAKTTPNAATEFTCHICGSGFVEEMTSPDPQRESPQDIDMMMDDMIDNPMFDFLADPSERRRRNRQRTNTRFRNIDPVLQMVLTNLSDSFGQPFVPLMQLHGNPGDYAWGRGGLDTVMTTLLNQMDSSGPPPMPQSKIQSVPKVLVTSEQVEKRVQCAICWDDLVVNEEVRKLVCDHLFHEKCIFPWLNLHATCPICRELQFNPSEEGQESHSRATDYESRIFDQILEQVERGDQLNPGVQIVPPTSTSANRTSGAAPAEVDFMRAFGFNFPGSSSASSNSTSTASSSTPPSGSDSRPGDQQGFRDFETD